MTNDNLKVVILKHFHPHKVTHNISHINNINLKTFISLFLIFFFEVYFFIILCYNFVNFFSVLCFSELLILYFYLSLCRLDKHYLLLLFEFNYFF